MEIISIETSPIETSDTLSIEEIDLNTQIGLSEIPQAVVIQKGHSPKYNEETQTWWEYDDSTKQYVDTHVASGSQVTLDYTTLRNKPSINGVELSQGQSNDDIHIHAITNMEMLSMLT